MTNHTQFPTLRLGLLQTLRELKREFNTDDAIFTREDCPYDLETIEILKEILQTTVRTVEVEKLIFAEAKAGPKTGVNDEDMGVVEAELRQCLDELRNLNKDADGVAKNDEDTQLKIIKAKASLIEQLVKLRERVMNVRRQTDFEGTVMGILEELVSEDDRAVFLRRLESYKES